MSFRNFLTILFFIITNSYLSLSEGSFQKINLGENINSDFDELMPILTSDGKTLYFCRLRHPENFGINKKEDIWYSTLDSNGKWTKAKNIGIPLNNEFANAVCSVTPDGNSLIIGGDYMINGKLVTGIFESDKTSTGWEVPHQLIIKNFYMQSTYISCCMSSDRNTIILALEREDSFGGLDLYASFKNPDDTWTEPLNLGKDLNTNQDDNTPFLAADGRTLYFSSKGHEGFGNYDVFVSRRINDSWTEWTAPENLGPIINTSGGDANYIISSNGDYAYFSSTESSIGGWDIFKIELPKEVKPSPILLLSGTITNKLTKDPVAASIYYQSLPDAIELGTGRTDPSTGDFKLSLPVGKNYRVHIEAPGYLSISGTIEADSLKEYSTKNKNFELSPADSLIKKIHEFKFDFVHVDPEIPQYLEILPVDVIQKEIFDKIPINFDYNKVPMKPETIVGIEYILKVMQKYPDFTLLIVGHTDNRGSEEYNLRLSEKRARAIGDYLVSRGISKKRISIKGAGFSIPVADNNTEEGMAKNRRGVFIIFKH